MKALIVAVASLFFPPEKSLDDQSKKPELTDSFSDVIKTITEEGEALLVSFHRHAAIYKVEKIDPKFLEIQAKLEIAQKLAKKIKVVAIIPSMTIKEITTNEKQLLRRGL